MYFPESKQGTLTDGRLWLEAFYFICTSELKLYRFVVGIKMNLMGVSPFTDAHSLLIKLTVMNDAYSI